MTPTTVDLADLLARVPDGVGIDMPGPEGGWAVAVIDGRVYRARVAAALRVGQTRCPECGMGATPNARGFRSHVDSAGHLCPNRDFNEETP